MGIDLRLNISILSPSLYQRYLLIKALISISLNYVKANSISSISGVLVWFKSYSIKYVSSKVLETSHRKPRLLVSIYILLWYFHDRVFM